MKEFKELVEIVTILRSDKGCPWDRAQRIDDLKRYLLEEVYELIDAIEGKKEEEIKEELGDVFLILTSMAHIYKEKGKFHIREVLKGISRKLIERHPHVFSSKRLETKEEVLKHWIKMKAAKKKRVSLRQRLPKNAPSLLLAYIFFKECFSLGNPPEKEKIISEIEEELEKIKRGNQHSLINLVWKVSQLSFFYHVDLENELRKKILSCAEQFKYSSPQNDC